MVNREGNYVCSGNCLFLFMLLARNWIIHTTNQKPIHPLPIPANLCGAAVQQPLQGLVMFGCSDGVVLEKFMSHVRTWIKEWIEYPRICWMSLALFGTNDLILKRPTWQNWEPQKRPQVTALLLFHHIFLSLQFKGSTKISKQPKKKHSLPTPTFLHGFRQGVNDLFVGSHTWARRIQL